MTKLCIISITRYTSIFSSLAIQLSGAGSHKCVALTLHAFDDVAGPKLAMANHWPEWLAWKAQSAEQFAPGPVRLDCCRRGSLREGFEVVPRWKTFARASSSAYVQTRPRRLYIQSINIQSIYHTINKTV